MSRFDLYQLQLVYPTVDHRPERKLQHETLFLKKIIYLFRTVLGLRCCTRAFSSCGERGLLFVVVRGLLIAGASLVAEHGL